jgi:putative nucleotidyltransferase with HDIG domain
MGIILACIVSASVIVIVSLSMAINQNRRQLNYLHDLDCSIVSGLSDKGVMNAIMDKLISILKPDGAAIITVDNEQRLRTLLSNNLSKTFNEQIAKMNNGFFSSVIDNKEPLNITKISDDENESFLGSIKKEGFLSHLSTPIIAKGSTPVGILTLYSRKPRSYSRREMAVIDTFNQRIGTAIDRSRLNERIQEVNIESVRALVEAIELRDPYMIGHSIQVANLARHIAQELEFSEREKHLIEFAGLLHDVGKIIVPETILQKSTALSSGEWQIIKKHALHSAMIIEPIKNLHSVQNWVLHHHEKWDGTGYPDGMTADKIPLQSRILAVCDAYSAMTGNRPYRQALSHTEARREIKHVAGKQLDPTIVSIFLSLYPDISEGGEIYKEGEEHVDLEAKA